MKRHLQVFHEAFEGVDRLICYSAKANTNTSAYSTPTLRDRKQPFISEFGIDDINATSWNALAGYFGASAPTIDNSTNIVNIHYYKYQYANRLFQWVVMLGNLLKNDLWPNHKPYPAFSLPSSYPLHFLLPKAKLID